jgi:hypothetical protein
MSRFVIVILTYTSSQNDRSYDSVAFASTLTLLVKYGTEWTAVYLDRWLTIQSSMKYHSTGLNMVVVKLLKKFNTCFGFNNLFDKLLACLIHSTLLYLPPNFPCHFNIYFIQNLETSHVPEAFHQCLGKRHAVYRIKIASSFATIINFFSIILHDFTQIYSGIFGSVTM